MIANNCQLGMVFGGTRFLLFAMEDIRRHKKTIHQLQCSDILDTCPSADAVGAIRVLVAAALGNDKDAFFRANNIAVGIAQPSSGRKDGRPVRDAAKKARKGWQPEKKQTRRGGKAAATEGSGAEISVC